MKTTTTKLSVLAFLGLGLAVYGQTYDGKVGINTNTPAATLEIKPSIANASEAATTNEGLMAPQLSKTRVAGIITPVEGTLVYVKGTIYTTGANTTADARVVDITENGYYYYNGTKWVKSAATGVSNNIYTADGTLTGKRTVTMNTNDLSFMGGNIGVGTSAPTAKLDVLGGNIRTQGGALVSEINSSTGGVLNLINSSKTAAGSAKLWAIYNMSAGYVTNSLQFWRYSSDGTLAHPAVTFTDAGAVGIGEQNPQAKLHVVGDVRITNLPAGASTDQLVVADASGNLRKLPASSISTSTTASNGLTLASNNIKLGGILTEATIINQDNKDLTFTTGTTGKLNVNGNLYLQNRVYVVPNKNADNTGNGLANTSVAGANLRNYTGAVVPDYTDNDYMIILTNTDIDTKIELPSAKANPGRIIYLINGTTQSLGFSGTGTGVEDTLPFNFATIATRAGVAFVSTGKTWYPIGR
ncbi:hypothetical protein PG630_10125 [Riemerella anatipestifer]|nr:hypothetical protein [Riemerella anatipestifer]